MPVRALRVTFVGELGWELYCPTEYGARLWDALWEAGRPHGLVAGGYRAIDALRVEKGYRVWGADITPGREPVRGRPRVRVQLDKPGGFVGRDALAGRRSGAAPSPALPGARRPALGGARHRAGAGDGEIAGRVTTGGYGYRSSARSPSPTCRPTRAEPGAAVEVEVFGDWIGGEVVREPLYDPDGDRIRA